MMPIGTQTQSQPAPQFQAPAQPQKSGGGTPTQTVGAVQQSSSAPATLPSEDAVVAAAKQIESYLRRSDSSLEFQIDSTTGQTVVTVRNTATGDVVRQIPNEEVLRIAQRIETEHSTVLNVHV